MARFMWYNEDETGEQVGFPNTTNSLFSLDHSRTKVEAISDSPGTTLDYIKQLTNRVLNNNGRESLEISDCVDCDSVLFPTNNQSGVPEDKTYEGLADVWDANGNDNELYVLPWSVIILWCCLYGCISAAALIGNTLVMWVVAISRRMRTVTNMYISNLAFADFIIGLFTIPFQFQAALLQRWNLPDFMCAFCPFVQVLSVNVSVFTLSAIAVDRYRAVLYPLSPRVSKRKTTWMILAIWTAGFIIALPTELDYKVTYVNDTVHGGTKPFCSNAGLSTTFRMYYIISLLVIQYVFPLIILSGAYARMTTKLWEATVPGNKEESRDAIVLRNKKKVIKMLAVVEVLFAVCWLPLQLYNVLQFFFPAINKYKYINIIWFCFHWVAMSNSCCNPFIYALYNDKFQREFQTRLSYLVRICNFCKCKKQRDNANIMKGSTALDNLTKYNVQGKRELCFGKSRSNNRIVGNSVANQESESHFEDRREILQSKREQTTYKNKRNTSKSKLWNHQTIELKLTTVDNVNERKRKSIESKENELIRSKFAQKSESMKNKSENGSISLPAMQTAIVCCNSKTSSNFIPVVVTIAGNDGMCQV